MQKKLIALAAAAALTPLAVSAADVQIYGAIDTGLVFQSVDIDKPHTDRETSAKMGSAVFAPNRWGFRGTEDLGNGLKVGFNLEGQFGSDDGTIVNKRLFQRMAQLWVESDYGTLTMGRSGALRSGMGTTGIWGIRLSPWSNSLGDYLVGSKYIMPGSFGGLDNAITYRSPDMGGAQLHLQYSSKTNQVDDATGEEFEDSADRTWGVGLTYTAGPLHVAAVVDSILYADTLKAGEYDDSLMASLGAAYKFSDFTLYASGAWFGGMKGSSFLGHKGLETFMKAGANGEGTYKGYSLQTGVDVPVSAAGTVKVSLGWMDAEVDQNFTGTQLGDTDRLGITVGYTHQLSKRTRFYTGVGYTETASSVNDGSNPVVYEGVAGILHTF